MLAGELNRVFSETVSLHASCVIKHQKTVFSFICFSLLPQRCPLKSVEFRLRRRCCRQHHLDLGPDRFAMQRSSAASYWFYKTGVYEHVGAPPSVIWLWATWQKSPSRRHTHTHTELVQAAPLPLLHLSDLAEIRSRWRIRLVPSCQQKRR